MINNLQILRACAAILVVAFHVVLIAIEKSLKVNVFSFFSTLGEFGVDIFFVISGFVMFLGKDKIISPLTFLKLRFLRIAPLYWFFTLFLSLLLILMPSIFNSMELTAITFIASILFVSNVLLGEFPLVYLGWTLEWEFLFYFCFALSLFLYKGNPVLFIFLCSGLITIIAITTDTLLPLEFVFGMFAANFYNRYTIPNSLALTTGVLGVAILGFSNVYSTHLEHLYRALYWGVPAVLIILSVVYLPQKNNGFITSLGTASYSIYLVQFFSIPVFFRVVDRFDFFYLNSDVIVSLCVIFTVFLGCLTYRFVEAPLSVIYSNYKKKAKI